MRSFDTVVQASDPAEAIAEDALGSSARQEQSKRPIPDFSSSQVVNMRAAVVGRGPDPGLDGKDVSQQTFGQHVLRCAGGDDPVLLQDDHKF